MPSADFKKDYDEKRGKFMNGTVGDDEEYEKSPAVEADVKDMEKRKRVTLILNSEAFRDELESIVESQMKNGPHPASLYALQHLADLLLPSTGKGALPGSVPKDLAQQAVSALTSGSSGGGNPVHVPPIADLRGVDATSYSKGERFLRCKLAALFRLINQQCWAGSMLDHISARVGGENDTILVNPYGLQYHEVSASTLVKLDSHGNVVNSGSTTFGVNRVAVIVHTAVHQARPDVRCVIYLLQPDVQAVSALKCGLLRLSTESCVLGGVSYHDFHGLIVEDGEKESLARDLGAVNKVMLLRNQGAVVCGATVEEAWELTTNLVAAAQTQLKALQAAGGNPDNLSVISDEVAQKTYNAAWSGEIDLGDKAWKMGELHFEALMRDLDNSGMRTGYIYKNPLVKAPQKQKFDVEVPPASSSLGYFSDSEALRPTRNAKDRYIHAGGYERIEAEVFSDGDIPNEQATKIKWVRKDGEDATVKIDGPHQFTPVYSGKKEMKAKIGTMKDDRDCNKATAGYHSKILDGLSQQDQQRYQEATLQGVNQNVVAMSKGIVQREYAKDAVLLTDYSAPNPFDCVTDDEVETYRKQAERRAKGLPDEQPPSPPAAQPTSDRRRDHDEKRKGDKKKAATLGSPDTAPPPPPSAQSPGSGTDGEDKGGFTTGADTDLEAGAGTDTGKKGKKDKSKSFRLFKKK